MDLKHWFKNAQHIIQEIARKYTNKKPINTKKIPSQMVLSKTKMSEDDYHLGVHELLMALKTKASNILELLALRASWKE